MWASALAHCQKRFEGKSNLYNRVPSGGLGCFRVLWFRNTEDGKRAIRGGDGWQLAVEFTDPPRAFGMFRQQFTHNIAR